MDKGTEYPFDLGTYHRVIITSSPAAQQWFNRGLNWTYAFNHEEAVNCFRRAIASDQECVLAYWGLAYALGPNYNKPWESFEGRELQNCLSEAYTAVQRASEIINNKAINMTNNDTNIMLVEQALIKAIQFRYPSQNPGHDHSIWNVEYANAMRTVCHEYPNDLDIAALFADALMNITPWNLWNLKTGEPAPGANTIEIKEVLEKNALSQPDGPKHPGVLHMYIHLMEMSGTPESALRVSDNLRGLVPDAGHLNHMPSHLDVLCGEYRQAIMSNTQAIHADEKYVSIAGPLNFYTLYRAHNYHFRLYAAMLAGISGIALETVAKIETCIPEELLRVDSPPMADWLEGFLGMRVHVLIRFGQWEDILALEVPEYQDLYCFTTAMIHYGKGIANAILGKTADAHIQQDLFTTASKRVPSSRTIFNNTCTDILAIGQAMLAGEIDYRSGNIEQGFSNLKKAIALDDGLPYDEPWGWMQPPRHAYGALLLEQGRVQEALEVYEADLGISGVLPRAMQHPNNVWSLHGLYECLITLGRGNEASLLKRSLDLAVAVADVPIKSSCFCRLDRCH
ncbi:TPR domain protein [Talaromyces proteolyticus]|uniref:TPR domain protein n=1 Tax=Talaromyces proteolyticus TaxID=1131652 RepID=A0AAD4Q6L9_9EURO|nr:TPR domain protein [Talaromyces proteolyticus]KAH8705836.1 TPR domain protein [Talaromyces proteolyticus]